MFAECQSFDQDLSEWDVSNVTEMDYMFNGSGLSAHNQCTIHEAWSYNDAWPYNWECLNISHLQDHYMILEDDELVVDLHIETVFDSLVLSVHVDTPAVSASFEDSLLTLTPDTNWHGETWVMVTAADTSYDYTDTLDFHFVVESVDDAPTIVAISDTSMNEDETLRLPIYANDVDSDGLLDVYTWGSEHIEAHIFADGDSLLLVPYPDWYGEETIKVKVFNDLKDSTFIHVTVNSVDDEPFVEGYLEDFYLHEDFDEVVEVHLGDIFTDIDGELSFTAELTDSSVVAVHIDGDHLRLFSHPDANGMTEMVVTASNPMRASVSDTVMIEVFAVNDAPVLLPPNPIVMAEDATFMLMSMAELMEEGFLIDVDNLLEDLQFELHTNSSEIHIDWDGDVFSSPMIWLDENYYGMAMLELCVDDGEYRICGENTVTVEPVNDAPYFSGPMEGVAGLHLDFHFPLETEDIDSGDLTIALGDDAPEWVMLDGHVLHGYGNALGHYPVPLHLSDGDSTVMDTFDLHVENFIPEITSITDVSNDQGGRVYVSFNASFFDHGHNSGQSYSLFRHDHFDNDSSGWVALASVDAIGDHGYTFEGSTLMDSTVHGDGMTEFKVVASMHGGIFHSEPMMGYSLDNIAPGVPGGLMAVAFDEMIEVSWSFSNDEDFQYFIVEKSTTEDFASYESFETVDTLYSDLEYTMNASNYYRVAAVDYAGNVSDYSDVVDATVLSLVDNTLPEVYAIHQNYPNPFNPTTSIKYQLPEESMVNLTIYDVMGRKVMSLINSYRAAGYHSVQWDATNDLGQPVSAGMYIYTIQAGDYREVRKMILLK